MCGRYVLKTSTPELAAILGAEPIINTPPLSVSPRFNIAPTAQVPIVKLNDTGKRVLVVHRWGLVPHWAKDLKSAAKMINARAETVTTKPSFRSAFARRRCLVPVDGYYEWQRSHGNKQPYFIHAQNNAPLVLAGLWERWSGADAQIVETCTILTTDANADVSALHHRMPLWLNANQQQTWLHASSDDATALLHAPAVQQLCAFTVSSYVNNARNDDARCITPLAAQSRLF